MSEMSRVGWYDRRCKIVGPTCGFVCGVVAAIICWPCGALVKFFYTFNSACAVAQRRHRRPPSCSLCQGQHVAH